MGRIPACRPLAAVALAMVATACAHIEEKESVERTVLRTERSQRVLDEQAVLVADGSVKRKGDGMGVSLLVSVNKGQRCEFAETPIVHETARVTRTRVEGWSPLAWALVGTGVGGGLAALGGYMIGNADALSSQSGTTPSDPARYRSTGTLVVAAGVAIVLVGVVAAIVTGVRTMDSEVDRGEVRGLPAVTQSLCDPVPVAEADVRLKLGGVPDTLVARTSAKGRAVFSLLDVPTETFTPEGDLIAALLVNEQSVPVAVPSNVAREIRSNLLSDTASRIGRSAGESESLARAATKKAQDRDLDGALKDFTAAIDLNPRSAIAYLGRGMVHMDAGQRGAGTYESKHHAAALSDLKTALKLGGLNREQLETARRCVSSLETSATVEEIGWPDQRCPTKLDDAKAWVRLAMAAGWLDKGPVLTGQFTRFTYRFTRTIPEKDRAVGISHLQNATYCLWSGVTVFDATGAVLWKTDAPSPY